MKAYLMGILCAAFLVSVLHAAGGTGAGSGLRKLIGGVFLSLVLFRPMGGMELPDFSLEQYRHDARSAVEEGKKQAESARTEFITEACETYILTKAAELGLSPEVTVMLDGAGLPSGAALTVSASPEERSILSGCITRELGIGKEAIRWIDPYQSSE